MRHYVRPDGLPPVYGYSHAVAFTGPMIVVSGQVPVDADGRLVGKDDPAAQIRQAVENLTAALAAARAGMDQVVKLTVFLTGPAELALFRRLPHVHAIPDKPPPTLPAP